MRKKGIFPDLCISKILPEIPAIFIGMLGTIVVGVFCLRQLVERLGPEHRVSRVVRRLPLISSVVVIQK